MFGRFSELREIRERLTRIEDMTEAIERGMEDMPTEADLQNALNAFKTAVVQAVTDAAARVTAHIDALKAQIAAGGTVSQADLDAVAATQQETLADIATIDAPLPPPP